MGQHDQSSSNLTPQESLYPLAGGSHNSSSPNLSTMNGDSIAHAIVGKKALALIKLSWCYRDFSPTDPLGLRQAQ
jgi:hypothetical protein